MTEFFWTISLLFTVWMCIDAINRKEHFVWIIVMIVLIPVGALAYFFTIKNKARGSASAMPSNIRLFKSNPPKELDNEETLQLKEMINKFHKAYHYEKLGGDLLRTKEIYAGHSSV